MPGKQHPKHIPVILAYLKLQDINFYNTRGENCPAVFPKYLNPSLLFFFPLQTDPLAPPAMVKIVPGASQLENTENRERKTLEVWPVNKEGRISARQE